MEADAVRRRTSRKRAWRRFGGQSMTEFVVVLPILLLLILGAVQFGLVYHAKATLNLAAFEAARAGALNRGSAAAMTLGLANGLRPLFTYGTKHGDVTDGFMRAKTEVNDFSTIEVINPTHEALTYWKGRIPNDNLSRASDATPSGMKLQDANILKIKVTYCHPLQILLLRNTIISLLQAGGGAADDFTAGCYKAYRLPIVAQGIVRMQSDYCPGCQ